MAEIKLSDNQKLAVYTRNKNILVSAAAGAGKTFVLVRRIIELITKENIDIDSLLIVTFTNAAAAELRERISKAIHDEILKNKGNKHLLRQATLLNKASISTMDSFCGNILKSYSYKTDLDPSYRVFSDADEINKLKKQVIDELFNDRYEANDEAFIKLVNGYCREYNDNALVDMIISIYDKSCNSPYPKKWLELCRDNFNTDLPYYSTPIGKLVKNIIYDCYNKIKYALSDAEKLTGFDEERECFEAFYSFCNSIENMELEEIEALPLVSKIPENTELNNIHSYCTTYINRASDYINSSLRAMAIMPYQKEYGNTLIDLIIEFSDRYMAKKIDMKVAEFNDIQHYTLNILRDEKGEPTDVANSLKNKYYEIIIDEYQDNNNLQEEIFSSFARNADDSGNMFMVGDIKQSIYRFRQANPEIFMSKYKSFPKSKDSVLVQLSDNYRSKSCVIDFCNYVFRNVMTEELGGIDYTPDVELKSKDSNPEIYNKTDIYIYENPTDLPEELADFTNIDYEALKIASIVEDILEKGREPKDIAILSKTAKNIFYPLLKTFANRGIPATVENESSFSSTLEIQTMLSFLKVIDNPLDNLAVITLLSSHIYNINSGDLVKIKLASESKFFYDCITEYINKNSDTLSQDLNSIVNSINIYREYSKNNGLSSLLSYLYDDTGYYTYLCVLPNGKQRQANLRVLSEQALSFETYNKGSLSDFIEYIESSERIPEASINESSDNSVKIMTIHKSKGLEFPVVILGFTGKGLLLNQLYPIIHSEGGFAIKHIKNLGAVVDSPSGDILKSIIKRDELSEAMRLLYVALTRAKEKLIITGTCKGEALENYGQKIDNPPLHCIEKRGVTYLDYICSALSEEDTDLYTIHKIPWDINNIENIKYSESTISISSLIENIDSNVDYSSEKDSIVKILDYEYHNLLGQQLPTKISISEIKRMSNHIPEDVEIMYKDIEFSDPSFMVDSEKALSGAAKGTIYHSFFEHMDFANTNNEADVLETISNLVKNNVLTKEEAEIIDVNKIMAFMKSKLYTRLQKSRDIHKETPFMMSMSGSEIYGDKFKDAKEGIIVHGIIDLYFVEGNEIVLVDYKTDKVKNHNINKLADKYKIQLMLYKQAIEKNTGMKVKEAIIYSVYEDKELVL